MRILENSLAYILLQTAAYSYRQSVTFRAVGHFSSVFSGSTVCAFFTRLMHRDSSARHSFTYSFLEKLCTAGRKAAVYIKAILEGSFIYTTLKRIADRDSRFFPLPKLVYIISLYVFIDYLLRDLLGISTFAGYWDEIALITAFGLWLLKLVERNTRRLDRWTPLDIPLLLFFGVGLFIFIVNSPNYSISFEGFRAVAQYMLWFFVIIRLADSRETAKNIYTILVLSGTLLAVHGILQYAAGTEMPSHWVDIAEKGVRTRAFSIIGSPNILGSMMLFLSPMSFSLFFAEKDIYRKLFFLGSTLLMGVCLLFTFSRGAWLGMAAAALVYILLKDRRLLLPFVVAALLAYLIVPSVSDRITYMLSDEYIASSFRGGRLGRWLEGIDMAKQNPWLGAGLGHFGGAVAKNNNIPGTFYMDNYYLKTVVEMGFAGLAAFLVLIYNLVIWSLRTIKKLLDRSMLLLSQGAFAGLCGILVHNLAENVFEEPMMVTYFWITAALIFVMGRSANNEKRPGSTGPEL